MNFRKPTPQELFPHAMQQDLAAKRATAFVNDALLQIGKNRIEQNLPTELFIEESNAPMHIDSQPTHSYIGTYVKNNWMVMVLCVAAGVILLNMYQISNEKKAERNRRNLSRSGYVPNYEKKSE